MKIVKVPILKGNDQFMFHLTPAPQYLNAGDQASQILAILAEYAEPGVVGALMGMCYNAIQQQGPLSGNPMTALSRMRLPDGAMLVEGSPEWKPTVMEVTDPAHPFHGESGEIIFAEGETVYLWVPQLDKAIPAQLSQIRPVALGGGKR